MRRTTSVLRVDDLSGPEPGAVLVANMPGRPDLSGSPLAAAVADLTEAELEQLEDELDFYVFGRFAGPLLARLLPLIEG